MYFATFISIQNVSYQHVLSRSVYHFKVIPLSLWELPLKSGRCFVERLLRMDSRVYSKYSQLLLLQSIPLLCIPQCFWCITNLIFLEQTCTQAIFWCVSLYEQLLSWIIKSKNRSIYSGYFQWVSHHACVSTTRQHLLHSSCHSRAQNDASAGMYCARRVMLSSSVFRWGHITWPCLHSFRCDHMAQKLDVSNLHFSLSLSNLTPTCWPSASPWEGCQHAPALLLLQSSTYALLECCQTCRRSFVGTPHLRWY